jgi:hypothetical protein
MSYSYEITVWCDFCDNWESVAASSIEYADEKLKGNYPDWIKYKGKNFCCAQCKADFLKEQLQER